MYGFGMQKRQLECLNTCCFVNCFHDLQKWNLLTNYIFMNSGSALSDRYLLALYLAQPCPSPEPIFQILAFETSDQNPKEIIIRLSDGSNFIDATLNGPYDVSGDRIVVSSYGNYMGGCLEFRRMAVVRIVDFFSRIDETKICRLKIMVRKMVEVSHNSRKIGQPQEIAFYVQLNNLIKDQRPPFFESQSAANVTMKNERKIEREGEVEIKIYDEEEVNPQVNSYSSRNNPVEKKAVPSSKEMQILSYCKDRNPDEPLTYRDVVNGFDGFFIGRLVRMKHTFKDSKDGSLPMISLGFVDSKGEIMRLNLLGKMAVREQKRLQKGKCYYLKGLQVVQIKGNSYIKLREKDYKLYVITDQNITGQFAEEYYHWEHEYDYIDNENVDIVGVIEDIEEKTSYGIKNVGDATENKEVIRVVIKNKFKVVKISFWSDQLNNLAKYCLKKGEVLIIEDVKKKKIVFLDFSIESTLIKLEPESELYKKVSHLLPEYHEYVQPRNLQDIYSIQRTNRFNTKVHSVYAYLSRIQEDRLIVKMCDLCKKKINLHSQKCFDCKGNVMSYKYNATVEFSDYSGSMQLSLYDNIAEKMFTVSALRLFDMRQDVDEYERFIDNFVYRSYLIGVEIKNERYLLRSVQPLSDKDIVKWNVESCQNIAKLIKKDVSGRQEMQSQ